MDRADLRNEKCRETTMTEETLFHEALAKPASKRAAFLDAACAGQPELRAAVAALLAAHEDSADLLHRPAAEVGRTGDVEPERARRVAPGDDASRLAGERSQLPPPWPVSPDCSRGRREVDAGARRENLRRPPMTPSSGLLVLVLQLPGRYGARPLWRF